MLLIVSRGLLSFEEERARQVMNRLAAYRTMTDEQVAVVAGLSRQAISHRRTGRTRIALGDLAWLCEAFGVEREVFFMSPDDALRWVLDHPREVTRRSSWISAGRLVLADAA